MKRTVFSAAVLAIAIAVAPAAHAASEPRAAANPQGTDQQNDEKRVASEAGLALLFGLMLGVILVDAVTTDHRSARMRTDPPPAVLQR